MNSKEMKSELRSAFYGYRKMTGMVEKKLSAMGFVVCRSNRHIILRITVNGKPFQFSVSSTASDNRSCKNLVSLIYRTLKNELDA